MTTNQASSSSSSPAMTAAVVTFKESHLFCQVLSQWSICFFVCVSIMNRAPFKFPLHFSTFHKKFYKRNGNERPLIGMHSRMWFVNEQIMHFFSPFVWLYFFFVGKRNATKIKLNVLCDKALQCGWLGWWARVKSSQSIKSPLKLVGLVIKTQNEIGQKTGSQSPNGCGWMGHCHKYRIRPTFIANISRARRLHSHTTLSNVWMFQIYLYIKTQQNNHHKL